MEEKILSGKKNGMAVLLAILLAYVAAIAILIISVISREQQGSSFGNVAGLTLSIIFISLGWIFLLGLKVLKPQEALVLTLFRNLKGEWFLFCQSILRRG